MVQLTVQFPVKKDAYVFRKSLSDIIDKTGISISTITKSIRSKNEPVWSFVVQIPNDDENNKTVTIAGGKLDYVNNAGKDIWAFSGKTNN